MVDWGSFTISSTKASNGTYKGVYLLTTFSNGGQLSRGLSMARTLGSEEADQVTKPGRRVLIGWTGGADAEVMTVTGTSGAAQSLPRDLSLAKDKSLLQQFIPELQVLRQKHFTSSTTISGLGLQAEVYATFSSACAVATATCGIQVAVSGGTYTAININQALGLVVVDATKQNNFHARAGPIPPVNNAGGYDMHLYIDRSIIELIVNNATAFVVYFAPPEGADSVAFTHNTSGSLDAWTLSTANPGIPHI